MFQDAENLQTKIVIEDEPDELETPKPIEMLKPEDSPGTPSPLTSAPHAEAPPRPSSKPSLSLTLPSLEDLKSSLAENGISYSKSFFIMD